MYQHPRRRVAPAPTNPEGPRPVCTTAELQAELVSDFALVSRSLLFDGSALDADERQFLYDFARSEARYPMVTLARFCKLARRARRPENAELLPALIRARCIAARPSSDIATLVADAAEQVGEVTRCALSLVKDPSRTNRERVSSALRKLNVSTRQALDAVA